MSGMWRGCASKVNTDDKEYGEITTEIGIKLKGGLGLAWEYLVGHGDRYERAGLLRNIFGDLGLWRGFNLCLFLGMV